jgi:Uri superfamily endonuclease
VKGIYIIIIALHAPIVLEVSNKRRFVLHRGFYAYAGSALGGLEARIARHLSTKKKYHWHIDYLLRHATVCTTICAETKDREECLVARELSRRLPSIGGFGCSDCNCSSHLFFSRNLGDLKEHVVNALKLRNLNPVELSDQHTRWSNTGHTP